MPTYRLVYQLVAARLAVSIPILQLLIPAIMLAVGLGLIKASQPKDFPSLEMSTAPLNADRRKNLFAQVGPNRVPWMSYKSGFNLDDPRLTSLFTSMPQGNVSTSSDGMAFSYARASALDAVNTNGFIVSPEGTPLRDWQRMSEFLINDKPTYAESKYGAYIITGNGTYYDSQPSTLATSGAEDAIWTYTVMHNTTFRHGGPTFVNVLNTAIYRRITGDPDVRITVRNHVLPFTKQQSQLISSIFNFGEQTKPLCDDAKLAVLVTFYAMADVTALLSITIFYRSLLCRRGPYHRDSLQFYSRVPGAVHRAGEGGQRQVPADRECMQQE